MRMRPEHSQYNKGVSGRPELTNGRLEKTGKRPALVKGQIEGPPRKPYLCNESCEMKDKDAQGLFRRPRAGGGTRRKGSPTRERNPGTISMGKKRPWLK